MTPVPALGGVPTDSDARLVRYESLLAMIESLIAAETVQACAASAAIHLKYLATVSAWRVLLQRDHGFLCVDAHRGESTVTELIDLPAWDQSLWDLNRPQALTRDDLAASAADGQVVPPHLAGPMVGELRALPFRRAGQAPSLLLAATRAPAFAALDQKFLHMAGGLLCDQLSAVILRNQAMRALQDLAWRDGLTGLVNRRALDELLAKEFVAATRHRRPLSLLLIDIDHFKSVNDTHGHQAGDGVLREVARRVGALVREGDVAGRYGGEEFLVVLHSCSADGAREVGERIRAGVAARPIPVDAGGPDVELQVTISLGGAEVDHNSPMTPEQLLAQADAALYAAKAAGRNRLCIHPETHDPRT